MGGKPFADIRTFAGLDVYHFLNACRSDRNNSRPIIKTGTRLRRLFFSYWKSVDEPQRLRQPKNPDDVTKSIDAKVVDELIA
jgi:hypothetical protein